VAIRVKRADLAGAQETMVAVPAGAAPEPADVR